MAHWSSAQNDDFADALELTEESLRYSDYISGFDFEPTAEPSEPDHAGSPAEASFWFKVTLDEDRVLRLSQYVASNQNPSRIAVYTGSSLATLTPVASKIITNPLEELLFQYEANTSCYIAYDSPGPDSVSIEALPNGGSDERATAELLVGTLPLEFVGNNGVATVAPDDEVFGGSIGPNATVWWSWTAGFSGTVRLDVRESEFPPTVIIYEEEEGGELTRIAANIGPVTWVVTAGQTYFLRLGAGNVDPGALHGILETTPSVHPPNDNIANARHLGDAPIVTDGAWMYYATSEEGLPVDDIPFWATDTRSHQGTAWWTWTCPKSGHYTFTTMGSDRLPSYDSVYLYTGTSADLVPFAFTNEQDVIRANCTEGTTYWIQVNAGWFRSVGRAELAIYPSETRSPYFRWIATRFFRIQGADRHPYADPDHDGVSNILEIATNGDPEKKKAGVQSKHFMAVISGQMNFVWGGAGSEFLTSHTDLPLEFEVETSPTLHGPWTPGTAPIPYWFAGESFSRCPLPVGGNGGYARLRLRDPNLEIPD